MKPSSLFRVFLPVGAVVGISLLIAACSGPAGQPGPAGPTGPTGPQGPAGPAATTAAAPAAPVQVTLTAQSADPGAAVTLKPTVKINDSSTVQGFEWTQTGGPKVTIDNPKSESITVTLPDASALRTALLDGLKLQDRFEVQAINPHSLDGAEIMVFKVTATTSSGKYSGTVNVTAKLPYVVSTGLRSVPAGQAVLLNGKQQSSYSWSLAGPTGSKATLDGASSRNPLFTPDVAGKYTLTEATGKATIEVTAGTWAGAISGLGANGRPDSAACTACHNGTIAPDKFTPWKASGHAEIFMNNLNTSATYSEGCFACHSVGFDKSAANGGFDDAADFGAFLTGGLLGKPKPTNYSEMLTKFPKAAGLANIQCENCHGPNVSSLHANQTLDKARISLSADVCGSCHGEPARHGRFQQWEDSRHAGTSTTPARGVTNAHCGRCHSAQGFLAWIKQDSLATQIQGKNGNATRDEMIALGMTADEIEPVTCAVCHDPHAQGTVSGEPTAATRASSATVRVMDVTKLLPSGFKAENVGKGALCITCHNTRNGPHNEEFPTNQPTNYSAPHTAAQGDVLLGQSAYFVEIGARSPHASVIDSCVTCHMEATPPPPEFSYQGGGTNHSFRARTDICGACHTPLFSGSAFQTGTTDKEHELAEAMGAYMMRQLPAQFTIKDYTPHEFNNKRYDVKSSPVVIQKDNVAILESTEPHGQQGFIVKFKTPVKVTYAPAGEAPHEMTLIEAEVQLGDFTSDGTKALIPVTDVLVKAGWNFFLIEGDGSKGVHNPAFSMEVLNKAIEALK